MTKLFLLIKFTYPGVYHIIIPPSYHRHNFLRLFIPLFICLLKLCNNNNDEKALRETQTLHAGCSKAEPKNFAPPQTPSRGRGTAKIQSAGDGHYLHLQTQFGEDRCTQFQVIVVTDSPTHPYTNTHTQSHTQPKTNRQDRL